MAEITNSKLLETAGIPNKKDACVVIVRTEWNEQIVNAMENGCMRTLKKFGVRNISVVNVPGAFEIAFAI
ncbi:MAG: 6,7-dimethyl-8-ribityllumazine synthase, partial [Bacteroidetes bacterium]|nr:6,7-dimethyl-8-ribityllumazine synthase [Bacteroidota bacterium]